MKQVLSQKIGLIMMTEPLIIEHPTTIFTNDDIEVGVFDTDEQLVTFIASKNASLFPVIPEIGEWCEGNKVYVYGDDKAKCLKGHNRMHYAIEETPALWLIIPTISGGYPQWIQPTGAHDAYKKGDRVHFPTATDPVYESLIDANVWSPTVYGWVKI